ncbi:MAG: nucleoside monophosphate kinase [bacterium]|nr:nucleoside monophosphate kinase [bacterium]
MNKRMVLILYGPQGSGKGTQAKILADKLGLFQWDMGAILRDEHDFKLTNGKTVGEIIDKGILLADPELLEVIKHLLPNISKDQGIIFDGIPRRIGQAKFLLDYLRSLGFVDFKTLFINVSREESMKRLMLRAQIQKRVDDTPESIERRLKQYDELTAPLLEYLKTQMDVITVNGDPPIPEVTKEINSALGI